MERSRKPLMRVLSRTYKEWMLYMRRCAREVGMPDSYRPLMMFLSHHPGANQKQLADFSETTTAAVNQTVKKMVESGYVRKEVDPADQRYTRLYLTERGMEKAGELRGRIAMADDRITARIGAYKEEEMVALLRDLCKLIGEEL